MSTRRSSWRLDSPEDTHTVDDLELFPDGAQADGRRYNRAVHLRNLRGAGQIRR